jgi:hypothetical protein
MGVKIDQSGDYQFVGGIKHLQRPVFCKGSLEGGNATIPNADLAAACSDWTGIEPIAAGRGGGATHKRASRYAGHQISLIFA